MAHSHEQLLLQLLESLRHEQVLVWVHIDHKSQPLFERMTQQPGIRLVQHRVDVKWAHISQAQVAFSAYREIKASGDDIGHLLIISGQDLPVQPMQQLVNFFTHQQGKSFMGYTSMSKNGWAASRKRFRYHYYVRYEKWKRWLRRLTGIYRQFPLQLQPFVGPQWINVAKEHMDYIMDFWDQHPGLQQFMLTTRFPEEMLFQTILLNSMHRENCINNDLRYIKWLPGKSNPEILTEQDSESIRNAGDKFFARKFDLEKSAVIIKELIAHLQ